ncbi:LEDI-1 protein [Lithospermum erythrorhizon]|uniref:LEDI-1 protein n=1 Tax=Lithospermum erythrorhizon TaxID=34254 RepID=Q40154_LITER|nr:pathogenesis-related protein PR1 [Lithospermum erythrorhizon]BAA07505.1 LEDI-1 protein [Lithospermum erythrorhizon]
MAVVDFNDVFTSTVPAPKLFKAWFIDCDTLLPKIAPEHVKKIDVEGNGGPGSIKCIHFGDAVPVKLVKFKIDALDESNLTYADTVIEGGELSIADKILKVTHEVKIESSPEGGCKSTSCVKFYLKEGTTLTEDEVKESKEGALGLLKAVEAHVLAN